MKSDDNITYTMTVTSNTPLYDSQGAPILKLSDMRVNDRIDVTGKFGYNIVELGWIKDLALSHELYGTLTAISSTQVSVFSTTLVAAGATYTAAITSSAQFYDKNGIPIAAARMKNGDSVYVSGLTRGTTITLGYIKDFSYPP